MRDNVPGDGFCVGASQSKIGAKCSTPIGLGQRACVAAVNAFVHSLGLGGFEWTSLQFNRNTDAQLHTDRNNKGLSLVLILGEYDGGSLCVPGRNIVTPPGASPVALFIDGRETHYTTPRVETSGRFRTQQRRGVVSA